MSVFSLLLLGPKLSLNTICLSHNQPCAHCATTMDLVFDSNSFKWFHSELIMSIFHREGFRDNLHSIEILHQPAGELCHLQAHGTGRALAALPVLQRLLCKDLWEGCEGLHPPGRWWEDCCVHRWVQWYLSTHWRKCGFLDPGGTTQCIQLRPKCGSAGEITFCYVFCIFTNAMSSFFSHFLVDMTAVISVTSQSDFAYNSQLNCHKTSIRNFGFLMFWYFYNFILKDNNTATYNKRSG